MFPFLADILLVNPLILSALAALPILWFLLRVTPCPENGGFSGHAVFGWVGAR